MWRGANRCSLVLTKIGLAKSFLTAIVLRALCMALAAETSLAGPHVIRAKYQGTIRALSGESHPRVRNINDVVMVITACHQFIVKESVFLTRLKACFRLFSRLNAWF